MKLDFEHRYDHYCKEHNASADEMEAIDKERHSNGAMSGYVLWLSRKWKEWKSLSGSFTRNRRHISAADHANFNSWLASRHD